MIIRKVGVQDSSQVPLSQHDHMIQALSADRANQPLHIGVLPGTLEGRDHLLDAHGADPLAELLAVDLIMISATLSGDRALR